MKSVTLSFVFLLSATGLAYPTAKATSGSLGPFSSEVVKRDNLQRRQWIRLPWIDSAENPSEKIHVLEPQHYHKPLKGDTCMCANNAQGYQDITSRDTGSGDHPPKCHCPKQAPAKTHLEQPQYKGNGDDSDAPKVKREAMPWSGWKWHLPWIHREIPNNSDQDGDDDQDNKPTYGNQTPASPVDPTSQDVSCDAEPACPAGQTGKPSADGSCQCTVTEEPVNYTTTPDAYRAPALRRRSEALADY